MGRVNLGEDQHEILNRIRDAVITMDGTWKSFLYFFGTSKERASFLSEASPKISALLGNFLWDATLTRIRALTDRRRAKGNDNLSLECLVGFCGLEYQAAYQEKFETLRESCEQTRQFATKHIVHFDLKTKLDPTEVSITRRQTSDAIDKIWDFYSTFQRDILDTYICREVVQKLPDERDFLELLYLGKRSQEKRREDFIERFLSQENPRQGLPNQRDDLPEWLQEDADQYTKK